MTDKQQYKLLCELHPDVPLFAQYWYMECVCKGKEWNVILIRDGEGQIVASMPYLLVNKYGMRAVMQPVLSQTNGVWIADADHRSQEEKTNICNAIIQKISELRLKWFFQNFDSRFDCFDPFLNAGFRLSQRNTYVIEDIGDLQAVFAAFSAAKQRHIRKAERNGLKVDWQMQPGEFYDFHSQTLMQRGKVNHNSREVEVGLCQSALALGKGVIARITDTDGRTHAALFVVWHSDTAYYLIPATDERYKASGASTLVVWETLKYLQGKVRRFDFEGSMIESVAHSYRQFGTAEVHYFQVEKISSVFVKLWKLIHCK
ncbi:MAG: GNAT family N-acetyltransferase [Bacteroidales bacterium]|nr:GNAT family N-acetyltransferase [Bacteroidales bacterium]